MQRERRLPREASASFIEDAGRAAAVMARAAMTAAKRMVMVMRKIGSVIRGFMVWILVFKSW